MKRLLVVAFFLEIGFLLLIIPWSAFWDRNYFAHAIPVLESLITNNFVRGAVSGLGLVNIYLGIAELIATISSRPVGPPPPTLGASHAAHED